MYAAVAGRARKQLAPIGGLISRYMNGVCSVLRQQWFECFCFAAVDSRGEKGTLVVSYVVNASEKICTRVCTRCEPPRLAPRVPTSHSRCIHRHTYAAEKRKETKSPAGLSLATPSSRPPARPPARPSTSERRRTVAKHPLALRLRIAELMHVDSSRARKALVGTVGDSRALNLEPSI